MMEGGCTVVEGEGAWLDTLDGLDSGLGKFSYRAVIGEFSDLVSKVSEVSSDSARRTHRHMCGSIVNNPC